MNIDVSNGPVKIVGMEGSVYHSLKQFDSRSFLLAVSKGGGEAQRWLDQGYPLFTGNSATKRGGEFDEIVMGMCAGKTFDSLVCIPPDEVLGANGSRSTKAYKEWEAAQTGICCTADQAWVYRKMIEAMERNSAAKALMDQTSETQLSVFWQEVNGHLLKVRPDGVTPDLWWDLKTTSATWDRLYRSVFDYGYAEQQWLYCRGAEQIGYEPFRMPFVFVQTMPPYACHVFYLPDDLVEEAGQRLLSVMEEVRLRRSTGVYMPADHGEITELEIPAWARGKQGEVVIL
jgi:hypothetical protein